MANSYQYRYRVEGGEWFEFSSWSPPSSLAQTIAAEAARHYWNKHSPPEADMWPLPFEIEGRGEFEIDVEARPEFIVRRKARVSSGDKNGP